MALRDVVGLGWLDVEMRLDEADGELGQLVGAEQELGIGSLAGRFAAKEALAKALGAPAGLHWVDAEVVTEESGQPRFVLTGTVAERAQQLAVASIHLSISHDAGIASAVVVAES